ncbi:DUF3560 domain-containing protein [Variovorax sp. M-6]|uniref:DUF3560 domain-containing protein n=1 Tax=Variovorax sp. M-6 TaxID=3233041 RepID=UPI003F94524D
MTNRYEDKQAARRDRFEGLAAKNARLSEVHREASHGATEGIPFGQPILVGHHSEGRHRAALQRARNAMDRSCEAQEKAEHYARKAAGVGKGGISSDDPAAIEKLHAELARMRTAQERMKEVNRVLRRFKDDRAAQIVGLQSLGWVTQERARELVRKDFAGRIGFASYALTNNNASMRRVELRIKELEANRARIDKEEAAVGYTYREVAAENRVMFLFDSKPDESTRKLLKAHGFKWSPSREGQPWVRHLNNAGLYHASVVRKELDAMNSEQA